MVPFRYYETIDEYLKQNSLPLIALEQSPDSIPIHEYSLRNDSVLLLGEEVHGIEPTYLEVCDAVIEIPMKGQKESFNVSVATGIALYALSR